MKNTRIAVLQRTPPYKHMRAREFVTELTFKGSPCTRDCSGHRAGYEWYKRKRRIPMSRSRSFDNGAALAAAGK